MEQPKGEFVGGGGSGSVGHNNQMIRANPPTGILRVEVGSGGNRSRKSSTAELKTLQPGEPTSPQPSIDRLSVTFADDSLRSDNTPRGAKMDKVHFPDVPAGTENTDSDEEDYSASVNAIILKRESTRRRSKRWKSTRRTSSPYSPDILPENENERRPSNFTTSSDTAITVDDNLGATQEQIFENIKLHKEVLSNVKMQPWNMRKKLKLVTQAKSYIKRHEGALQERLAQSRSTKDILARWNIYFLTNWQKYRREMANLSNWFIPWESKIKEIESHFGSVVASYFIFLRWLFWVNIVLAIVLISFVAVPETMWIEVFYFLCSIRIFISGIIYPFRNDYREIYKYVPPEEEVTFFLYHSSDLSRPDQLYIDDILSIQKSKFDHQLPTKIIIHGWTHGKDVPWMIELRETMAQTQLWNIIVVDWAPLSHAMYSEARIHTIVVGKQVSYFCIALQQATDTSMSSIHMIGHSMGAQIAAIAGHRLQFALRQTLGRITGLDPAAPLYEWPHVESLDETLDPNDALFVDVIHTNAKHLGILFPAGHVDYYPNGGERQPGCGFWSCSHLRSCEFWIASIKNPELFQAYSFDDWDDYLEGRNVNLRTVPMGIAAGPFIPIGSYFLETDDEERKYVQSSTTIRDSF